MSFTKPLPGIGGFLKLLVAVPLNHGPKLLLCGSPAFFVSMATRMLQLLAGEVRERKAQRCDPDALLFGENEMLIFVGMSLGRLLRPFEYFMCELLSLDILRKDVDLEGVTIALVRCRQPNDTTGPTFKYGLNARHPRQIRSSAWTMRIAESQITGIQTDPCSQYLQLTRATHETIVYLHDFPCGTPRDKVDWQAGEVPRTCGHASRA